MWSVFLSGSKLKSAISLLVGLVLKRILLLSFLNFSFGPPCRWLIWSAQAITSQWKTTKWSSCTHLQSWTTNQSGCSTTSLSSPPRTTSAHAQTSSQSGTCTDNKISLKAVILTCVALAEWRGHPCSPVSVTGWWRLHLSTTKWVTSHNVKLSDSWSESLPN